MWQTTGRPHQLQPPPDPPQKPSTKSPGRRRPAAISQAKPDSWTQPQSSSVAISAYPPQQGSPDPSPDPPDMPGINRAGLLNLRNKLRLNRPALISPPSNSYSILLPVAAPDKSHGMSHGHGAAVNQENLAQPYQPSFPQSSSEVTPAKMAAAAATARLARRRAAAQETTTPSSDPNSSPGDVRRGEHDTVHAPRANTGRKLHVLCIINSSTLCCHLLLHAQTGAALASSGSHNVMQQTCSMPCHAAFVGLYRSIILHGVFLFLLVCTSIGE